MTSARYTSDASHAGHAGAMLKRRRRKPWTSRVACYIGSYFRDDGAYWRWQHRRKNTGTFRFILVLLLFCALFARVGSDTARLLEERVMLKAELATQEAMARSAATASGSSASSALALAQAIEELKRAEHQARTDALIEIERGLDGPRGGR